ncbi:MAG: Ig-like domain-containing protein [Isosphaeraceae bacterium]|nr:Ig-like domain-containing protein [Isosphaeraceae bacterium]
MDRLRRQGTNSATHRKSRRWNSLVEGLERRELLTLDLSSFNLPMILRSDPTSITTGPDGNLYFAASSASKIVKAGLDGRVLQEFPTSIPLGSTIDSLSFDASGNLWFSERSNPIDGNSVSKIARMAPDGSLTEFAIENGQAIAGLTVGPDGNLWFTSNTHTGIDTGSKVGRMTPDGTIVTFAIPGGVDGFGSIVTGSDGNLWFAESSGFSDEPSRIGRITTAGVATTFALSDDFEHLGPMIQGPDGNVWFAGTNYDEVGTASLGKIAPDGSVTTFRAPADSSATYVSPVLALSRGGDGNVWFAQAERIGRVTPAGEFATAERQGGPLAGQIRSMTLGSDGQVWYTSTDYVRTELGKVSTDLTVQEFDVAPSFTTDPKFGISVTPDHIVRGPDGAVWFTTHEGQAVQIRRIAPDGTMRTHELSSGHAWNWVTGLTPAGDGHLWFTIQSEAGGTVGRVAPDGTVTKFDTPSSVRPLGVTAADAQSIWVVGVQENGRGVVVKVALDGTMRTRNLPAGLEPTGVVADGPGDQIWLGASRNGRRGSRRAVVAAVDLGSGRVVEHTMPRSEPGTQPIPLPALQGVRSGSSGSTELAPSIEDIARGIAGALSDGLNKLMAPSGSATSIMAYESHFHARSMTMGPDGNMWVAASANGSSRIIRITPRGRMKSFEVPAGDLVTDITVGPDGNLWFSTNRGYVLPLAARLSLPYPWPSEPPAIGRITLGGAMTVFRMSPEFSGLSSITTGPDGKLWVTDVANSKVAKITAPALFSGELDSASRSGSLPNAVRESRPSFSGVANPNSYVTLLAKAGNGEIVTLGRDRADASGRWSIRAERPLADGRYEILGGETGADGFFLAAPAPLSPFADAGPLIVDTRAPRVAAADYDAESRKITLRFTDVGAGFATGANPTDFVPMLGDLANYTITPRRSKSSLAFSVAVTPNRPEGEAEVVLTLEETYFGLDAIQLRIHSNRFADQAGNSLDGESRGTLPSGNGRAGGDFVSVFRNARNRA